MAATDYTPLQLYYSTTATNVPTSGNLVDGELAINIVDGKLYYKDNLGVVQLLASKAGSSGLFTNITVTGTATIGTLSTTNAQITGGAMSNVAITLGSINNTPIGNTTPTTGVFTTATANSSVVTPIVNGSTTLSLQSGGTTALTVSASQKVGIGTASPLSQLHVVGGNSNNMIVDNNGQQYTTFSWYNNGVEKAQAYWDQTNGLFVSGTDVTAAYVFKTNAIERARISGSTGNMSIGTASTPIKLTINGTDAVGIPSGTTAQRPGTPILGYMRYNSDYSQFEGYSTSGWSQIGGGATGGGGDQVFVENGVVVTTSYTLSAGKNASSVGPITINGGVTVTIPDGQRWVIL